MLLRSSRDPRRSEDSFGENQENVDPAAAMSASNSVEQVACEDLKAFERRLTEIISSAQPSAIRWRLVLVIASVCVAVGAVYWLGDPKTAEVSFQVLRLHFPPQLLSLVQFSFTRSFKYKRHQIFRRDNS